MGVRPIPDDLFDKGTDGRPLLLHRHFVNGVLECGQHLRQQVKLNICQGMAGGQLFQLR